MVFDLAQQTISYLYGIAPALQAIQKTSNKRSKEVRSKNKQQFQIQTLQWNIDTLKVVGVYMNNDTFSANVIDGAVSLLKKQKPKLKSDHDSASIVYMHPDSLECLGIPPEDGDMIRAQLDEDGECKYNQAVFVRVDRENHSTSAEPQDAPGSPEVGVPSSQHSD